MYDACKLSRLSRPSAPSPDLRFNSAQDLNFHKQIVQYELLKKTEFNSATLKRTRAYFKLDKIYFRLSKSYFNNNVINLAQERSDSDVISNIVQSVFISFLSKSLFCSREKQQQRQHFNQLEEKCMNFKTIKILLTN